MAAAMARSIPIISRLSLNQPSADSAESTSPKRVILQTSQLPQPGVGNRFELDDVGRELIPGFS